MTTTRIGRENRRGFIAAALMLGLIVLAMLMGLLIRSALMQRTEIARAERRLQAEALAQSGLERAAALLRTKPDLHTEVWEVSASELGRRDDGLVTITIEKVADRADQRRIVVKADYPKRVESRARVTRTTLVDLKRAN